MILLDPEALLWPGVTIAAVGALGIDMPLLVLGFTLMAAAVAAGSVHTARQLRDWWRAPSWRAQVLAAVVDARDQLLDVEIADLLTDPEPTTKEA